MTLSSLIRNIKWRIAKRFYSKDAYNWFLVKIKNDDFKQGRVISLNEYSFDAPQKDCAKRVVCIYDGKIKNGGLADRLRGIVSVYQICKELNIEFKLIFDSPFNLTEFLQPNMVNWEITKEELNYNLKITDNCFIETYCNSKYEAKRQECFFRNEFKKRYKEFHVRTNAFFSYNGEFSRLFNELFKISPKLQESIDREIKKLGNSYISTSFRFMDLLGDFNETFGRNYQLNKNEKELLISQNIEQIKNLYNKYPDKYILVNSDSTTFLQRASALEFVYVIPGNVTHIDGNNENNKYETYEKTFLDFFMIANAERIYLLRTGGMYNSGYPFAASKIYNKPFEKIEY